MIFPFERLYAATRRAVLERPNVNTCLSLAARASRSSPLVGGPLATTSQNIRETEVFDRAQVPPIPARRVCSFPRNIASRSMLSAGKTNHVTKGATAASKKSSSSPARHIFIMFYRPIPADSKNSCCYLATSQEKTAGFTRNQKVNGNWPMDPVRLKNVEYAVNLLPIRPRRQSDDMNTLLRWRPHSPASPYLLYIARNFSQSQKANCLY